MSTTAEQVINHLHNVSDPEVAEKLRQEIRNAILSTKAKSILIEGFGTKFELRQPNLRTIMAARDMPDGAAAAATMLIEFAYVPGTNLKVFEDVDVDAILGLPFGKDLNLVQEKLTELTDVEGIAKVELGNSEKTPPTQT